MNLLWAATFLLMAFRQGRDGSWVGAGLHVAFALAFLVRRPERRAASSTDLLAALPSLVVAALLLHAAGGIPFRGAWQVTAWAGAGLVVAGVLSLGRSFAVLPGVRTLQTGGLYRVVRHPVYAGEAVLAFSAAASLGWAGLWVCAVLVPLLWWRIEVEERLLRAEPDWAEWASRVRYRLVPGLW